ncbi:hypothetical protein U9M48_035596 [Paspalum notatum var. saurae]|uniref:Uncharacterized protein n=1 Tax=Paspalum notatum var. saurae TaxID=547442 RepID=A0AAQ3UBD2_PASNO
MWSSDSDNKLTAAAAASSSTSSATTSPPQSPPPACLLRDTSRNSTRSSRRRRRFRRQSSRSGGTAGAGATGPERAPEPEAEDVWCGAQWEAAWPARRDAKPVVVLAAGADDAVGRSRSLTDDDLEELKGCADLGFGFSYDEIPELRGTLPALELCYSMTQQRLLDDKPPQRDDQDAAVAAPAPAPPVTNWKISSPGDSPDEVKARLKYWAQAVACTVRLCS